MTYEPNWLAIERDYCAGFIPESIIAERYNISLRDLHKYVKERKLIKQDAIEEYGEVLTGVSSKEIQKNVLDMKGTIYSPDDLTKAALISASSLIELHQKDLSGVRQQLNTLLEKHFMDVLEISEQQLKGLELSEVKLLMQAKALAAGQHASAVAGLMRVIEMERKTYRLDKLQEEDPESKIAEDQNALLDAIKKQLTNIIETKSAYTGSDSLVYEADKLSLPNPEEK